MKKFITNPYFKKGLPGDNGIDPVSTDVEAVKKLLSLCPKAAETPLAESAKSVSYTHLTLPTTLSV